MRHCVICDSIIPTVHINHDGVIKWNNFRATGALCAGMANSPHKGQWRGALMFFVICTWTNENNRVNNRDAGDLRRHGTHYDVLVMVLQHMTYLLFNVSAWAHQIGITLYWVDAYDPEGDGSYVHSHTGIALPYVNWASGEPNYVTSDKCGIMIVAAKKWMNDFCLYNVNVICEH